MKKEITLDATIENIPVFTAFIDETLEALDFPMKAQMQVDVAADEILSNIAHYAYPDVGSATVVIEDTESGDEVFIRFIDTGVQYDPLEKDDPDITLGVDEREIGGLGIFMTKKLMDGIEYEYKDGQNILTLHKKGTV